MLAELFAPRLRGWTFDLNPGLAWHDVSPETKLRLKTLPQETVRRLLEHALGWSMRWTTAAGRVPTRSELHARCSTPRVRAPLCRAGSQ